MECTGDLSDPGFRAFDDIANRFGGLAWNIQDRTKVKYVSNPSRCVNYSNHSGALRSHEFNSVQISIDAHCRQR